MNLLIEYNKALDLLFATYKYYRYCSAAADGKEALSNTVSGELAEIIIPSRQIMNWMKYVNNEISPFLKNDLMLLYGKIPSYPTLFDTCLEIIYTNNITEPEVFIDYIRDMPDEELVRAVYKYSEMDVSFDWDYKTIFDEVCKAHNEEIAGIFIQIKKFPSEYKDRIISLFDKFYHVFVEPHSEYVYPFMEEKLKRHNEMIENDPLAFLNIIGNGDYSKAVKDAKTVRIFVSYYFDSGTFYTELVKGLVIMYGFYKEERFNQQVMQDKYKNLFKALSDEKRLEILRLASKRPWYNKELADYFDLTSATLSYHLNFLFDLGILNFEPSNYNRYYYTTNKEALKAMFEYAYKDLTEA